MATKKPGEAFAMSDNDEFIEESSSEGEGGSEDGEDSNSGQESGSETDGDNDESGKSEGDGSDDAKGDGSDDAKGEKGEEGQSEGDASGEAKSTDGDGDSETKGESKGEESEGSSEGKEGEGSGESSNEFNFFEETDDESSGENSKAVDFKKLGSTFGFELEEGTEEEFAEKVNKKIEDAKLEIDVTSFDPEAQRLVKHLNKNGGKIGDFFVNPKISNLQNVLTMNAEDKYRMIRKSELTRDGSTAEEVTQEIDQELGEMNAKQIMDVANKIDTDAQKLIADEINEIVGESEQNTSKKQQEKTQEVAKGREALTNYVHKQDDFLGLKLTEKTKQTITKDIETGKFDEIVDLTDAEARLAVYMIKRSGTKIKETFARQLAEKSREGFNAATDKHTSRLHKSKGDAQGKGTGHQETGEGAKNFENWASMDI